MTRLRANAVPVGPIREQMQYHLEQTKNQQERLKALISKMGGQPTISEAKLPAILSGEEKNEIDLAREDAIVENSEFVTYKMLLLMAQKAGLMQEMPPLQESLQEETAMVNFLSANASLVIEHIWPSLESEVKESRTATAS